MIVRHKQLVVYGGSLTALCAISTAMRLGVKGSDITWVAPSTVLGVGLGAPSFTLHNDQINEAVRSAFTKVTINAATTVPPLNCW